jgi:hypothetical protein
MGAKIRFLVDLGPHQDRPQYIEFRPVDRASDPVRFPRLHSPVTQLHSPVQRSLSFFPAPLQRSLSFFPTPPVHPTLFSSAHALLCLHSSHDSILSTCFNLAAINASSLVGMLCTSAVPGLAALHCLSSHDSILLSSHDILLSSFTCFAHLSPVTMAATNSHLSHHAPPIFISHQATQGQPSHKCTCECYTQCIEAIT